MIEKENDMTQEEKQLLTKDLCSRLPYGVVCRMSGGGFETIEDKLTAIGLFQFVEEGLECVPYLRPLYSMTEDEARFILKFIFGDQKVYMVNVTKDGIEAYVDDGVASFDETYVFHNEIVRSLDIFDYLNERQFDYRGLIEKGLALVAPEDMYQDIVL